MTKEALLLFAVLLGLGEQEVVDVVVPLQGAGGALDHPRRAFPQVVAHLKSRKRVQQKF